MPVPPTSISAATITSQAMPIEMRMPVRIVGAAAGRITVKARLTVPTSSVRATLIHSLRTEATPNAVLSSIGHTEQMKMTKIAELDAETLVVRPVVVERPLDVLPQFGADIERTGHRRLALGRGRADQFCV